MKNKYIYISIVASLLSVQILKAQDDNTIDRTVTVEREITPTIKDAGKINVQPEVIKEEPQSVEVKYSDYSTTLSTHPQVGMLDYAQTGFVQPRPLHGFVRGGVGHSATMFDFAYQMREKKNLTFDIRANHLGQWGRKTISHSSVGIDLNRKFDKLNFFVGADATNVFFTRYGRYFSYSDTKKMKGSFGSDLKHYSDFAKEDKSAQWEINTKIGIRSDEKQDLQYLLQTGYEAFIMTSDDVEHIINTKGKIDWKREAHHVGADVEVQNHLFSADLTGFQWSDFYKSRGDTVINNHHALKVEPYYAYMGNKFWIHAGVNLDFCFGKGKLFLPSPNVTFEAKLTKDWLALYGGAVGDYNVSSVREHFQYLRYLHPENEICTTNNRTYNPIDAFLGLKIRPQKDLLVDISAKYNYTKYDVFYLPDKNGYFNLIGSNHWHWTLAANINYHYQDMVNVSVGAFYNIWKMLDKAADGQLLTAVYDIPKMHILDRPSWGVTARVEGKIDSKWSVYSDNYFGGGRYALNDAATVKAVRLKPTIDLNLGMQYNVDKWLSCYLQLNNYINRKHDLVYGYQSQGINFMAGVSYSF